MPIDFTPSGTRQMLACARVAELGVDHAFHLDAEKLDRAQQVLLGQVPQIRLEELTHMPHLSLKIDDALGNLLGQG
jgi:hypothetical protein